MQSLIPTSGSGNRAGKGTGCVQGFSHSPGGAGVEGKAIERPSNVAGLDERFRKAPASRKRLGHQKGFGLS